MTSMSHLAAFAEILGFQGHALMEAMHDVGTGGSMLLYYEARNLFPANVRVSDRNSQVSERFSVARSTQPWMTYRQAEQRQ
jgi:hypothetical protein